MSMFGASEESPRMFESDFFDFFSRTHFLIVPLLYVPASIALAAYSVVSLGVGLLTTLLLVVGGIVAWTLTEYWLHRTFFHWEPDAKWGPTMHFFVHGVHHKWPRDKYRLVMPPAVSITLFFGFLAIWWLLLGDYGLAFHAGFVVGYMAYDLTHYYVHHGKPKLTYFKKLRRHHMSHHFNDKYKEARFGVSTRIWDRVFGTMG
jgi:sterol desaturase/sphingolipid hydroxylase (fatty acid hydroxylase superfamily)